MAYLLPVVFSVHHAAGGVPRARTAPSGCRPSSSGRPPGPGPLLSQGPQRVELDRHVLVPIVGADHEHTRASLLRDVPNVVRGVAGHKDTELFEKMLRQRAALGTAPGVVDDPRQPRARRFNEADAEPRMPLHQATGDGGMTGPDHRRQEGPETTPPRNPLS